MKSFILKCILFICLLAIVDFCSSALFMLRDRQNSGTTGRINHVINHSDEEVLILGSSRAVRHFNSRILEDSLGLKVYNIGVDGNGIVLAKGITDLESRRHRPKIIIFELFPHYDYVNREGDDIVKFSYFLKPYFDTPEIRKLISQADPVESLKMKSSLYRLNSILYKLIEGIVSIPSLPDRGFIPQSTVMNYEPRKPKLFPTTFDPAKAEILSDFISTMNREGVRVFFTISPIYSYPDREFADVKKYVESKGGYVFDYLNDSAFLKNRGYFADRVHLNTIGADTLSSDLASKIKSICHQ